MTGKWTHQFVVLVAVALVTAQVVQASPREECCPCGEGTSLLAGALVAGAVIFAPWALPAIGFTAGGIGGGTLAAKAMSVAWTTGHGGAVVSTLQSAATYAGAKKAASAAGSAAYTATKAGCCSCH
eukprot:TRINITY_DN17882_c0_g1_i2.p1 TRINITY_DN17882_c0_g1~~TRINITY_DN17882_c0_g1_i2.p1  ORF type:complete len:126 (-),score=15.34 TRINITY_DN17882_c0_g1_i2:514-891(-)